MGQCPFIQCTEKGAQVKVKVISPDEQEEQGVVGAVTMP
jgi:hypothetical protein